MKQETINQFKRESIKEMLRCCRLFEGLDSESLNSVVDTCRLKPLAKGENLFMQGEKSQGFYIVQSGVIALYNVGPDGKEQVICLFRENESFAEATLVSMETYPAHARAEAASQVVLVSKRDFRALIVRNPDLSLRMLASMSQHLKYLVHQLEDRKFTDIESRFANWMIQFLNSQPGEPSSVLELPVSKKMLASQLGVTGETLSRTLNRFREQGLIQVEGKRIEILNFEGILSHVR